MTRSCKGPIMGRKVTINTGSIKMPGFSLSGATKPRSARNLLKQTHDFMRNVGGFLYRCVELDVSEQTSLEYTKQLLLSQVLTICQKLSPEGTPVSQGQLNFHASCFTALPNKV